MTLLTAETFINADILANFLKSHFFYGDMMAERNGSKIFKFSWFGHFIKMLPWGFPDISLWEEAWARPWRYWRDYRSLVARKWLEVHQNKQDFYPREWDVWVFLLDLLPPVTFSWIHRRQSVDEKRHIWYSIKWDICSVNNRAAAEKKKSGPTALSQKCL